MRDGQRDSQQVGYGSAVALVYALILCILTVQQTLDCACLLVLPTAFVQVRSGTASCMATGALTRCTVHGLGCRVGIPVVVAHCTGTRTPYSTDCSSTGGPSPLHRAMDLLVSSYVEKSNNTNDSASSTSASIVGDQVGEFCLLPAFQHYPSLLFGGHGASVTSLRIRYCPHSCMSFLGVFWSLSFRSLHAICCPASVPAAPAPSVRAHSPVSLPYSYSHASVRPHTLYR